MSRRGYKTVNLPDDLVDFLDSIIPGKHKDKPPGPLGVQYRDEFVRIAVALLTMAVVPRDDGRLALDIFNESIRLLESRLGKGHAKKP